MAGQRSSMAARSRRVKSMSYGGDGGANIFSRTPKPRIRSLGGAEILSGDYEESGPQSSPAFQAPPAIAFQRASALDVFVPTCAVVRSSRGLGAPAQQLTVQASETDAQ